MSKVVHAQAFDAAAIVTCVLFSLVLTLATAPIALGSPARVDQLVRTALELDASPARGKWIYSEHCAGCHGAAAAGDARKLIPALAGQRQAYLVKQLADFAELEREADEMHKVVSVAALDDPQGWKDLSTFLSTLPPTQTPETANGDGLRLGEAIYREQCASCHEEDARGDDDGFVPSLRDQHYSYLVHQMRSLGASHRLNVDPNLVRFLDSFDTEEITAVADYLSRLRGPTRDRSELSDDGSVRD